MAFTIRLQEYSGKVVSEISADWELTTILGEFYDPNSAVLRFLDPYDDTMLNSLQMAVLIDELEEKSTMLDSVERNAAVQRLIDLAAQGANGRRHPHHRQLWFIGD
jgi:hypothetical protein